MHRQLCSLMYVCLMLLVSTLNASERFLIMKIGPTWPRVLLNTKKPIAGDAAVVTGITFDQKISVGGGIDFLWNRNSEEKQISQNLYQVENEEKSFMFPVSGYIAFTPIPHIIVNPCLSGNIGLNTMYFSHKENKKEAEVPDSVLNDENGFYMGFFWKIAADAMVNIGSSTALFAGFDYQWTKPKKLDSDEDELFFRRDMSGIGIRMGFRAVF